MEAQARAAVTDHLAESRCEVLDRAGDRILDMVESVLADEPLLETDYCYRHQRLCPVIDPGRKTKGN